MKPMAPLDQAFFERLKSLGEDVLLRVTVNEAVLGNRGAIGLVLKTLEGEQWQQLLWDNPGKVSLPVKSEHNPLWQHEFKSMSLLQAVAMSLSQPPSNEAQTGPLDIGLIQGVELDQREGRLHRDASFDPGSWSAEQESLLRQAIGVCMEQCRAFPGLGNDPLHHLFQAVLNRGCYEQAVEIVLAHVEPDSLWSKKNASMAIDAFTSMIRKGMLKAASAILEHASRATDTPLQDMLAWASGSPDDGSAVFTGLLEHACQQRHLANRQAADPGLLQEEQAVIDCVRHIAKCSAEKQGDVILRLLLATLQYAKKNAQAWNRALVKSLVADYDEMLGTGGDWGHDLQARSIRGCDNTPVLWTLLHTALEQRVSCVLDKLQTFFTAHRRGCELDLIGLDAPWATMPAAVPVDLDDLRATTRFMIDAGCQVAFDARRGDVRLTTPLHLVAQTQHPQRLDALVALMDMGFDPRVKDRRRRTVRALLPDQLKPDWDVAVRSFEARREARAALQSLSGSLELSP